MNEWLKNELIPGRYASGELIRYCLTNRHIDAIKIGFRIPPIKMADNCLDFIEKVCLFLHSFGLKAA